MLREIKIIDQRKPERSGILYLTDDMRQLKALQKAGKAAAAVLTEANRSEDFAGIPYALEKVEELEREDFEKIYRRLAGLPWDILETARCRLREMSEEDMDGLYEIYREPSMTRYMENLSADRTEERGYIQDYRKYVYEFYGYGIWVIEEKRSGRLIGRAGLEPRGIEAELGFAVASPWQGAGIAYEVCDAVLKYGFGEIGCEKIIARVVRDNMAGLKLLKKLGFHTSGEVAEDGTERYEIRKKII